ncbi:MAG: hypothetical protein K6G33_00400 [Ruminococcus sp.]|uniref:dockerin type I domain-containing protein n=1 Tax=Ruminococcus sp. TaxID=41978 RepID=UPI0025D700EE|nr:dockerin type I domain-containing protein [Ruminococcus sp.]MCR5599193.1 hypothetical protein [Ruminococcus sp.]
MNKFSRTIAAIAAVGICMTAAFPASATFSGNIIQPSAVNVYEDDVPSFTSDEELLKYVRSQMKQRNEKITALVLGKGEDDESHYSRLVIKDVFNPTDDPSEGQYLYLGVIQSSAVVKANDKGVLIELSAKYRTTAAQEAELEQKIKMFKELLLSGVDIDDYTTDQKVKKAYDLVVSRMKLSDAAAPAELGSAYSALVKNTANEIGYTQLLIRALSELGIDSEVYYTNYDTKNNPLMAHYLVLVRMDDVYYFLDPVYEKKNGTKDTFFLKGYKDLDAALPENSELKHEHLTFAGITVDGIAQTEGMAQFSRYAVFTKGDVNGDNIIDSSDASSILAEYARLSSSDLRGTFSAGQKKSADIDNNNKIDSVDASRALAYYAYVSTTTGEPVPIEEYSKKK